MAKKIIPYRIVHLSDLHLTNSDRATRSEPKLLGQLTGMNVAFRKIVQTEIVQDSDLILVTGDVTDTGDIGTWLVFWDAINSAGLSKKVLVVPGNHDVCSLGLGLRWPNAEAAKKDMQKAVNGLKKGNQPIRFPWVRNPDPRVAIFGFNSNNIGNFSVITNARGYLDDAQLRLLDKKLEANKKYPVKIVALHHSPNIPENKTAKRRGTQTVSGIDRFALEIPADQRRKFRSLCKKHKAIIIHGHVHAARDRRVNGVRIIGSNATTQPVKTSKKAKRYEVTTLTIKGQSNRLYSKVQDVAIR